MIHILIISAVDSRLPTPLNKPMPAGYHEVEFKGQNLSSGVCLYLIVVDSYGEVVDPARRTGEWSDVRKMVYIE